MHKITPVVCLVLLVNAACSREIDACRHADGDRARRSHVCRRPAARVQPAGSRPRPAALLGQRRGRRRHARSRRTRRDLGTGQCEPRPVRQGRQFHARVCGGLRPDRAARVAGRARRRREDAAPGGAGGTRPGPPDAGAHDAHRPARCAARRAPRRRRHASSSASSRSRTASTASPPASRPATPLRARFSSVTRGRSAKRRRPRTTRTAAHWRRGRRTSLACTRRRSRPTPASARRSKSARMPLRCSTSSRS